MSRLAASCVLIAALAVLSAAHQQVSVGKVIASGSHKDERRSTDTKTMAINPDGTTMEMGMTSADEAKEEEWVINPDGSMGMTSEEVFLEAEEEKEEEEEDEEEEEQEDEGKDKGKKPTKEEKEAKKAARKAKREKKKAEREAWSPEKKAEWEAKKAERKKKAAEKKAEREAWSPEKKAEWEAKKAERKARKGKVDDDADDDGEDEDESVKDPSDGEDDGEEDAEDDGEDEDEVQKKEDYGCSDDRLFTDPLGFGCEAWQGHDCSAAEEEWGLSEQDVKILLDKCRVSCKSCLRQYQR